MEWTLRERQQDKIYPSTTISFLSNPITITLLLIQSHTIVLLFNPFLLNTKKHLEINKVKIRLLAQMVSLTDLDLTPSLFKLKVAGVTLPFLFFVFYFFDASVLTVLIFLSLIYKMNLRVRQ